MTAQSSVAGVGRESIGEFVGFLSSHWQWLLVGYLTTFAAVALASWSWRRYQARRGAGGTPIPGSALINPATPAMRMRMRTASVPRCAPVPLSGPAAPAQASTARRWAPPRWSPGASGTPSKPATNEPTRRATGNDPERARGRRRVLPQPKVEADPLWGLTQPLHDDVPLGKELGSGGQGTVHAVQGDSSKVYKTLASPVEGALEEYLRFVSMGGSMHGALAGANVDLVWPEAPRVDSRTNAITGYVMPRIPSGYTVTVRGSQREAHLAYALPKDGPFRPDVVPDLDQRLALVRAVGAFLDALHRHDYVYGDISWSNILYRLDPEPTVLVFDLDGARRLGHRPILAARALDTPDWADHADSSALGAGFDSDRYKYALLVYRMLVSTQVSAPLPPDPVVPTDSALPAEVALRLGPLLQRAAGGPGGRPAVSEWLSALSPQAASAAR